MCGSKPQSVNAAAEREAAAREKEAERLKAEQEAAAKANADTVMASRRKRAQKGLMADQATSTVMGSGGA